MEKQHLVDVVCRDVLTHGAHAVGGSREGSEVGRQSSK